MAVLILGAPGTTIKERLSTWYFDKLLYQAPRECQQLHVEVVDIDDDSLRALGQWPWPRRRLGELVQQIGDAGAAVIVLNMVFSEADRFTAKVLKAVWPESQTAVGGIPDFVQELSAAIAAHPVVGATALLNEPNDRVPAITAGFATLGAGSNTMLPVFPGALTNIPVFAGDFAGVGSFTMVSGVDQVARSVSLVQMLNEQKVPGLAVEAFRVVQGTGTLVLRVDSEGFSAGDNLSVRVGKLTVPSTSDGQMRLHYSRCAPPVSSAKDIFDTPARTQNLSGKIVLLGSSAAAMGGGAILPSGQRVPGYYVQAQAIEQMLQGWFIVRPQWSLLLEWLITLLGGVVVLLAMRAGVLAASITLFLILIAVVGASWGAFHAERILIDAMTPGVSSAVVFITQSIFSFLLSEKERLWVRKAFSQYLSPVLVQQLSEAPERL